MSRSARGPNRVVNLSFHMFPTWGYFAVRVVAALLLLACALPACGGALRVAAMFTSALDTPTNFVSFDVPAQPLINTPSAGNDDDLFIAFADGIHLEVGTSWVLSSNLGSLMQFDQNIPHLMVNEEYVPTDGIGTPVGGAGPYNNSVVGPTSALFINAFGIGIAPQPGDLVYGVLLRDVFEGAAPVPTQVLAPTSTFTISTPGTQAIIAHQVPEPGTWVLTLLGVALVALARRLSSG
jgi:PEP-CTERM motif